MPGLSIFQTVEYRLHTCLIVSQEWAYFLHSRRLYDDSDPCCVERRVFDFLIELDHSLVPSYI